MELAKSWRAHWSGVVGGCVITTYPVYKQPLFYATVIGYWNRVKWLIIVGFWFVFGYPGLGLDYCYCEDRGGGRLVFIWNDIDHWNTLSFGMVPMAIIEQTSGNCWLVSNWIMVSSFGGWGGGTKARYMQQFWVNTINPTRQTISSSERRLCTSRFQIWLRQGSCNNQNAPTDPQSSVVMGENVLQQFGVPTEGPGQSTSSIGFDATILNLSEQSLKRDGNAKVQRNWCTPSP